ncbi:molybdate ABC transporter substrate-binding protein [Alphaproteobacteria bacterium]|nr:molybdate ABC transporter substrate-binding protein [Alphaproteobacteria bacterium]
MNMYFIGKNIIKSSSIYVLFLLTIIIPHRVVLADDLYIGVASNFIVPMNYIKRDFENKHQGKIFISSGSSGSLYSQIINGAPLDIFLSGDQKLPIKLEKSSKGVKGTRFTYAIGKIQLFTTKSVFFNKKFPDIINSNKVQYIGIGNPLNVPYGLAAKEVLLSLGLYKKISSKLILSKNVNQVFLMSYFGNLDLAFVAKSDVINHNKKGRVWNIPKNFYSPIKQDVILLEHGRKKRNAKLFLKFLSSNLIREKIKEFGYMMD